MASTNKTTHYELSQFLGTDKPAWLTDYNSDMSKIDTGINTAQATATGADGKADTAATNIGNLENLTTTTKTSLVAAINEVDGHADGATESAGTANTIANSAKTSVDGLIAFLDLNNVNANLTVTTSGGANVTTAMNPPRLHSAYNNAGSLGKVYGFVQFQKTNSQDSTVTISDTGLRPSTAFTISDGLFLQNYNTMELVYVDVTYNTDGTATFTLPGWTYDPGKGNYVRGLFMPYIIFAKKFDA